MLRPHHLFCSGFLPLDDLVRGEEFARAIHEIREIVRAESDLTVIVTEGPDQLCVYCPEYGDGRCRSKIGDEEKVRKWDSGICLGLGISYGEEITVRELLALIREKAPLEFCRTRCPWKALCGVAANRHGVSGV